MDVKTLVEATIQDGQYEDARAVFADLGVDVRPGDTKRLENDGLIVYWTWDGDQVDRLRGRLAEINTRGIAIEVRRRPPAEDE